MPYIKHLLQNPRVDLDCANQNEQTIYDIIEAFHEAANKYNAILPILNPSVITPTKSARTDQVTTSVREDFLDIPTKTDSPDQNTDATTLGDVAPLNDTYNPLTLTHKGCNLL